AFSTRDLRVAVVGDARAERAAEALAQERAVRLDLAARLDPRRLARRTTPAVGHVLRRRERLAGHVDEIDERFALARRHDVERQSGTRRPDFERREIRRER